MIVRCTPQKGLEQALKDIAAKNGPRPWPETLDVCKFELEPFESHDDIKREVRERTAT